MLRHTCGSGFTREEASAVAGTGCAGVRGHARSHRAITGLGAVEYLWERVHPRRSQRGGWHRLRRCSRARPLPQGHHWAGGCGVPVGAGSPAKKPTRWLAPAAPVFAGTPAPTGSSLGWGLRGTCGSGFTREEANAVAGTGCAGVRGHARSHRVITGLGAAGYLWERVHPRRSQRGGWHRLRRCSRARPLPQGHHWAGGCGVPVGAGSPAKKPTRWLAPAAPVFAGTPAPTGSSLGWGLRGTCGSGFTREEANAVAGTGCAGVRGHAPTGSSQGLGAAGYLWERVHPRRSQRGGWHRLRRCSRACPLPQGHHKAWGLWSTCGSGRAREEAHSVPKVRAAPTDRAGSSQNPAPAAPPVGAAGTPPTAAAPAVATHPAPSPAAHPPVPGPR